VSAENVKLVRAGLEQFLATGEVLWSSLDEHVEVHDHDLPDAGEYRGHQGFARWLEDWATPWSEYHLDPKEYVDAGDRVVAVVHMSATGRGSGAEVEREDAIVYTVREAKITRLDYYNNKRQALVAAGLAE
jgi:ketosteroid isomerase-like protein